MRFWWLRGASCIAISANNFFAVYKPHNRGTMWNAFMLGYSCEKQPSISEAFLENFRIPQEFACFHLTGDLRAEPGYFCFGDDTTCYGRSTFSSAAEYSGDALPDASGGTLAGDG